MSTIMEKDVLIEFAAGGVAQMARLKLANQATQETESRRQTLNKLYRKIITTQPKDIDFEKTSEEIKKLRKI